MSLLRPTLAALLLLAPAACDDGAPKRGTTRVQITDAPFPYGQVTRADVHIVSVSAWSGDTASQVIVTPDRSYNLMELQGGITADLGTGVLTPGLYDRLDVTIDLDRSSVTLVGGTVLTTRSTPGLRFSGSPASNHVTVRASVDRPIDATGTDARVVIDFDLALSFQPMSLASTTSGFVVKPRVNAYDATETGSIEGTAASDGGPLADATVTLLVGDGIKVTTTRTDAAGRFRFPFVNVGSYDLLIEAPLTSDFGSTTRSAVTVSAPGLVAAAGTLTLPRVPVGPAPGTYVLRRANGLGGMQSVPVMTWPGPTQIFIEADTLVLEPDGTGSEVRMDRFVPPGGPPTLRAQRYSLTYTQSGRAISIQYPCSTVDCPQHSGMLNGSMLLLENPGGASFALAWPREYERVGP